RLKDGAWKIPVGLLTIKPATCPESALAIFIVLDSSSTSTGTSCVAYPTFRFCCLIPIAVTTTWSISVLLNSSNVKTALDRFPIATMYWHSCFGDKPVNDTETQ